MSWTLLALVVLGSGLALLALLQHRSELVRMRGSLRRREEETRIGADEERLRQPVVDLSRCLGCATCVAACPEEGVLELVHGQAAVVRGGRCVGHSRCESECPVGAITVTLANLDRRRDLPVVDASLEAAGAPGLFLAGEITGHALIKSAIEQGTAVAARVAERVAEHGRAPVSRAPVVDLGATASVAASPVAASSPTMAKMARAHGAPAAAAANGLGGSAIGGGATASNGAVAEGPVPNGTRAPHSAELDLVIVGAGPAGLACSLEAKRRGLRFVTLDQEERIGGTVAKYPRRKLVMTQPVELPIYGRFKRTTYRKEELVGLWRAIAREQALPVRGGEVLRAVEPRPGGGWEVRTERGTYAAPSVCVAVGRRGTPRRLDVPGEELPKVAYGLTDARSFRQRRVLVVGGGDSAIETALGLAEQPGNRVTLSYRRESFFRLRSRNEERLREACASGRIEALTSSRVVEIAEGSVTLEVASDGAAGVSRRVVPNDEVFVMAGGEPPFELLARAGVSFDPAVRESAVGSAPSLGTGAPAERGTGLTRAIALGFALSFGALVWALLQSDYYALPDSARPTHPKHAWLRPGMGLGLAFGFASAAMIGLNLLYLLRRSPRVPFELGSLKLWMTSHVATGILAFLLATLHAAMAPGAGPGARAWWALFVLLGTGAIGRYFYAWVPRAANGRELALEEARASLRRMSESSGGDERRFRERARREVEDLVDRGQWRGSFVGRALALVGVHRTVSRRLADLAREGREAGIAPSKVREITGLARTAHRTALMVAHYEDLRSVLATWRYLHRWVAALMVLLVVVHVVYAILYGGVFPGFGSGSGGRP